MSDIDLDAIEARANAATPGPWVWDLYCGWSLKSGDVVVCDDGSAGEEYQPAIDAKGPDAAFIAAARTDVPALIARVREQEQEIAELRKRPNIERLRTIADTMERLADRAWRGMSDDFKANLRTDAVYLRSLYAEKARG